MVNVYIAGIAIIAAMLGIPVPKALEQEVYLIPTLIDTLEKKGDTETWMQNFEWRLGQQKQPEVQKRAPKKLDWDQGPELHVAAAIVIDEASGAILWQENPDRVAPIASITKLMTALVWLDHQPSGGFNALYTFSGRDNAPFGKELNLPVGSEMNLFNIWHSTLIGSDNDTALALAHSTGLSDDAFVGAMNDKARALGLSHAHFAEPTGLSSDDITSVEDVARLALAAFSTDEIAETTVRPSHIQETTNSSIRTVVHTTNLLLRDSDLTVTGGKTGFTDEAGYCVVVRVQVPDTARNVVVVILGAESDLGRFAEAKKLFEWTMAHYTWK